MISITSVMPPSAGTFVCEETGKPTIIASAETASKLLKDFGVSDPIQVLDRTRRWGRVQIVNAAVQKLGHSM